MCRRLTPEQKKTIDELVEVKAGDAPAGIVGREWCEACGQLGSFNGFAGAQVSHLDYGRFVCGRCRDGSGPRPGSAAARIHWAKREIEGMFPDSEPSED